MYSDLLQMPDSVENDVISRVQDRMRRVYQSHQKNVSDELNTSSPDYKRRIGCVLRLVHVITRTKTVL